MPGVSAWCEAKRCESGQVMCMYFDGHLGFALSRYATEPYDYDSVLLYSTDMPTT